MSLRASAAGLAEKCPYSPIASEQFQLRGDDATDGTACHADIEAILRDPAAVVTHPLAEAARPLLVAMSLYAEEMMIEPSVARHWPFGSTILSITGHPDLAIQRNGKRAVIEWKTGEGSRWSTPPARDNLQLASYALATDADDASIVHVRPWVESRGEAGVDAVLCDEQYRTAMDARLRAVAERVEQARRGELGPVLGEHCAGCYGAPACPAQQKAALALTDAPKALDVASLPALLAALPAVEKAVRAVKAAAEAHVKSTFLPIDCGGRQWGAKPGRAKVDVQIAYPLLGTFADACLKPTITVGAVKKAGGPGLVQKLIDAKAITRGVSYGWIGEEEEE